VTLTLLEELKVKGKSIENVGSPIYMSPEACVDKQYSFSSDVYSLGIIWYELYHKRAPWEAVNE
jgi:serine/threonine protein kinase